MSIVLTGLAALVDVTQVHALLLARNPALLDPGSSDHDLLLQTIAGVTTEVTPLVGDDPSPGQIRDLAVWCVTLGVAAHLEAALFPEQQLGDNARASQLNARYLGVLSDLRSRSTGGTKPRGNFPSPERGGWPDPARQWPNPVRYLG